MTQTSNRIFDEMARLMNDAAGVAQGVRREVDTLVRTQAERILRDLDLVKREEFEAVKDMARLARDENDALKARIDALSGQDGREELAALNARLDTLAANSGREELDALKRALGEARAENGTLKARIDALEAKVAAAASQPPAMPVQMAAAAPSQPPVAPAPAVSEPPVSVAAGLQAPSAID